VCICTGYAKTLVIGGLTYELIDGEEVLSATANVEILNGGSIAPLPSVIYGSTAAFVEGKVRVCGGIDESGLSSNACYELSSHCDPAWAEMTSPTFDDVHLRSSVIVGEWLLSGGTAPNYSRPKMSS